jgi:nucleoside-diphosphate-sugar epimerase
MGWAEAARVASRMPAQAQAFCGRVPPDEPRRRRPDIARARSRLGWELNDGLRETIDHFRHLLGRPARHVSLVPDVAVVRLGSNG